MSIRPEIWAKISQDGRNYVLERAASMQAEDAEHQRGSRFFDSLVLGLFSSFGSSLGIARKFGHRASYRELALGEYLRDHKDAQAALELNQYEKNILCLT